MGVCGCADENAVDPDDDCTDCACECVAVPHV